MFEIDGSVYIVLYFKMLYYVIDCFMEFAFKTL